MRMQMLFVSNNICFGFAFGALGGFKMHNFLISSIYSNVN